MLITFVTIEYENKWGSLIDEEEKKRHSTYALNGESFLQPDGVSYYSQTHDSKMNRYVIFGTLL